MKKLLLAVSLVLPSLAQADVPFAELTFEEACKAAEASDRVVFIDFYTTWCGPCKKLDAITWKDEAVVSWLDKHTVALKIDAEKEAELAKRYQVKSYPSMVFAEANGDLRARVVGYKAPANFLAAAKDAMAGIKPSDRVREELAQDPNNPQLKKSLARELVRNGEHKEALELLLWCWDHGESPPHQSFSGVRVSFLLSDLSKLSAAYPPALAALNERRDAAVKVVLGDKPIRKAVRDFIALNKKLGGAPTTLEVYDLLVSKAEKADAPSGSLLQLAIMRLFMEVAPELIKAGRYEEAVAGFGEPMDWLDSKIQSLERMKALLEGDEYSTVDRLRIIAVEKAGQLYLALLGTGKHDAEAAKFATGLVEFAPAAATWKTLQESAKEAKREDIVKTLRAAEQEALLKAESSQQK